MFIVTEYAALKSLPAKQSHLTQFKKEDTCTLLCSDIKKQNYMTSHSSTTARQSY